MDLLDLSAAFSSLPLPRGNRVAVMTLGGGWGVVASDLCVENGLTIPDLSPELIAQIDQILPPYWSRSNPIDLVGEVGPEIPMQVIEALMKWDGCDAVIHLGILGLEGVPQADDRFRSKWSIPARTETFWRPSLRRSTRLRRPT